MTYVSDYYKSDSGNYEHLNISNSNIELQAVEVTRPNHKTTIVLNVYRPPKGNPQDFLNDINDGIMQASNIRYADLYLTGDLNLDHTADVKSEVTITLENSLNSFGLVQYITCPTRVTRTTSTLLDVHYIKTSEEN